MIELTCPAEEGIDNAHQRKMARYKNLNDNTSWTPILRTIEIGARGFVAKSVRHCFKTLGFNYREINKLTNQLSNIVVRCSYDIYLSRKSAWDKNKTLLG